MRRSRYGCATIFTIVGALFLCCGLSCVQCTPYLATQQFQVVDSTVPLSGTVLVSADGRTLTASPAATDCLDYEMSADVRADRVVLRAVGHPRVLGPCANRDRYWPAAASLTATLHDPVDSLSIVDGVSGRPLTRVDERQLYRFPDPGFVWVKAGQVASVTDFTGTTVAQGFGRNNDTARLWVIQGTGTWAPAATVVRTPVTVRGLPGEAAPGIVVWHEHGYLLAVRWDTEPYQLPPTQQLLALAGQLRPGEGG